MSLSRTAFRLAAALSVAVALTMGSGVVAPSPARASASAIIEFPNGTCPEVIVLGARGSGEEFKIEDGGLGTRVFPFKQRLAMAFGADRVGSLGINYLATSASNWELAIMKPSVDGGVDSGYETFLQYADQCTTSHFVTSGYSQGAWVIRGLLRRVAENRPELMARIAYNVFFGDPWYANDDPQTVLMGGGDPGKVGIAVTLSPGPGDKPLLPGGVSTVSFCHAEEPVCQSGDLADRHSDYKRDATQATILTAFKVRERGVQYGVALRPHVEASGPSRAGAPATFQVTVSNEGVGSSTTGVVGITLNAGSVPVLSGAGTGWACARQSPSLVCSTSLSEAMGPGVVLPPVTVTTDAVPPAQTVSLSATMDDTVVGGVAKNVGASAQPAPGTVDGPHLQQVIVAENAPFAQGVKPRWRVTVTNTGTKASAANARMNLSANYYYQVTDLTGTGTGWGCLSGGRCIYGQSLAPGASAPPLIVEAPVLGDDYYYYWYYEQVQLSAHIDDSAVGGADKNAQAALLLPGSGGKIPQLLPIVRPVAPTDITVTAGGRANWSVTVKNSGGGTSSGVITVQLSESPAAWSGTGWFCADNECGWFAGKVGSTSTTPVLNLVSTSKDLSISHAQLRATIDDRPNGGHDSSAVGLANLPVVAKGAHLQPVILPTSPATRPGAPLRYSEEPAWKVELHNTGTATSSGGAVVQLELGSLNGVVKTQPASGWQCVDRVCSFTSPIAAGAKSPALEVTIAEEFDERFLSGRVALDVTVDDTGAGGADTTMWASHVYGTEVADPTLGDLAIAVKGPTAPLSMTSNLNAVIYVRNVGRKSAPIGTTVSVSIPPNSQLTALSGTGWSCDVEDRSCSRTTTLAAGADLPSVQAVIKPLGAGWHSPDSRPWNSTLGVSAYVSESEGSTANNSATITTRVADPKTDVTATVLPIESLVTSETDFRRTVAVQNSGRSASTGSVTVAWSESSSEGPSLPVTAFSGTGWSCSISARECRHPGPVPAAGRLPSLTLTTKAGDIPNDVGRRSDQELAVTVTNTSDGDLSNNRGSVVNGAAAAGKDLYAVITPSTSTPRGGTQHSSSIVVGNGGTRAVTSTTELQISTGFEALDLSGSGWECTGTQSGTRTCLHDGDLAAGASLPPLTAIGTGSAMSAWSNSDAWLQADLKNVEDRQTRNNEAFFSVGVAATPVDLLPVITGPGRAQKVGLPGAPGTTQLQALVTNAGSDSGSGTVTVRFSTSYSKVISASGSGWACSATQQLCSRSGTLAAGEATPPITITVEHQPTYWDQGSDLTAQVEAPWDQQSGNNSAAIHYSAV